MTDLRHRWAYALVTAALLAGCGGSGGQTGSLSQPKQAGLQEVHPQEAPAQSHKRRADKRSASKAETTTATTTTTSAKTPGANLPTAKKVSLVKRLTPQLVSAFGYGQATVSTDGSKATVGVSKARACANGPTGPKELRRRVTYSLPFVKLVLVVHETAEPLESYAKAHCQAPKPPPGAGRVVLDQKGGEGMITTKQFKITSSKWTIAYADENGFLQIFAMKDGQLQPQAVSAEKAGAGKQSFKGPGNFALQISSTGGWSVQVRDGS